MRPPQSRRLDDETAEAVRASHHDAIRDLQTMPAATLKPLLNIVLPDGVDVLVPHGLGRVPVMHWISTVREQTSGTAAVTATSFPTAGYVEEFRAGVERTLYIKLRANLFGATIVVDLAVI